MEGEEGDGIRLSKRFSCETSKDGEVDYKTKAGTAWSHSYLNQKPWHPLSYPNQRRKWIAEQTHANRLRRSQEYAQEQEFFRQTSLISKKEKEKVEMMKAVSFMYVRPPGYNAESARAAEIADERKKQEQSNPSQDPSINGASTSKTRESMPSIDHIGEEKKKPRPKDVFGRPLPTEEEFAILKDAPRLETGVPARVKPFGVEVRNVKCVRCGNYGHQSGDRECPLKDVIMPNEESRLKRDDPLTAILAHTDPNESLKWELKQKPGISPPRGGFKLDDPNQQIVAEDIFDEYGGFLSEGDLPQLLTNFSSKSRKKCGEKSRHKGKQSSLIDGKFEEDGFSSPKDGERRLKEEKHKKKKKRRKKQSYSESSLSDISESDRHHKRSSCKSYSSSKEFDPNKHHSRAKKNKRRKHCYSSEDSDHNRHHMSDKSRHVYYFPSTVSNLDKHQRSGKQFYSSEGSIPEDQPRRRKGKQKCSYSYQGSDIEGHCRSSQHRTS
ncbi:hypothetical protein FNV43_RR04648 [Rhamnella rubrinervis]|uniref:CBF1-interacting co-repressor CIR N-terminal domain-containing protein n=1 Tax=Rhamnella rubrinervis TaxID=2594499 RepID=A0A8K0HJX3_9ROSA|nr:hypothetical protein FNV43_RR04648 [Rhamnella rubrinervis]